LSATVGLDAVRGVGRKQLEAIRESFHRSRGAATEEIFELYRFGILMRVMRSVAVLFKWLSEFSFFVCAGAWVCKTGIGSSLIKIINLAIQAFGESLDTLR
jgi:hypothetical protein